MWYDQATEMEYSLKCNLIWHRRWNLGRSSLKEILWRQIWWTERPVSQLKTWCIRVLVNCSFYLGAVASILCPTPPGSCEPPVCCADCVLCTAQSTKDKDTGSLWEPLTFCVQVTLSNCGFVGKNDMAQWTELAQIVGATEKEDIGVES